MIIATMIHNKTNQSKNKKCLPILCIIFCLFFFTSPAAAWTLRDQKPSAPIITPKSISPPPAKLLSPNGGEVWRNRTSYEIKWNYQIMSQVPPKVGISLTSPSHTFNLQSGLPNNGSYTWYVPDSLQGCIKWEDTYYMGAVTGRRCVQSGQIYLRGNQFKIHITVSSDGKTLSRDSSDNYFSISR